MKRGTPDHPKTRALARVLRINRAWAVGILEMLWHFAAQYAPSGDIGRYSDEEIAEACGWPEDRSASELIDALVACRWLDRDEEHRLIVHDWHEHADDAVHFRLAKARQRFANGTAPRLDGLHSAERQKAQSAYSLEPAPDHAVAGQPDERPASAKSGTPRHATARQGTPRRATECRSRSRSRSQAVAEPYTRARGAPGQPACADGVDTHNNNSDSAACEQQSSLDWVQAIETAIRDAIGRSPRPETAIRLLHEAASRGVHPRYLLGWIADRGRASPPRSDGLFAAAIGDLPQWVARNHRHDPQWDLVESIACSKCGEPVYVFRDVVIGCGCTSSETHRASGMLSIAEVMQRGSCP